MTPEPARARAADGTVGVALDTPEEGVAPGPACVFYRGDRVLGGGWIAGTEAVSGTALAAHKASPTARGAASPAASAGTGDVT